MAREIVLLCDPCLGQDIRTEGQEWTLGVREGVTGEVKPKVLALCTDHLDQLVKPVAALLDEFGENPEGIARPRGRQGKIEAATLAMQTRKGRPPANGREDHLNQCLWCELTYSGNAGGFGRHLRVVHGYAGLTEAFGGLCPVCGEGPFQQMMSHMNKAHAEMGFKVLSQPFTWARDNGDPHGVYAAKLTQEPSLNPEEEWQKTRQAEDRTRTTKG